MPAHRPQKYDFTYSYRNQTIPYSIWVSSNEQPITTILFLGTVQIGKLPQWVAEQTPPGTAVIQGVPHWLANEDEENIAPFVFHFTNEVFTAIFKTFKIGDLRLIAESQAVPGVLNWLVTNEDQKHVTHLALLQPLGLNADAFQGTEKERIAHFKQRITKNFRHQLRSLIIDPKLRYNHRLIITTTRANKAKGDAQYASGLSHSAINNLTNVLGLNIQTIIICGSNDMMFPPKEIKNSLNSHHIDIPIVTISGVPHSPPATQMGMKLVSKAFEFFENT